MLQVRAVSPAPFVPDGWIPHDSLRDRGPRVRWMDARFALACRRAHAAAHAVPSRACARSVDPPRHPITAGHSMTANDPRAPEGPQQDAYWSREAPEVLAALASRPQGLSSVEAAERLARHGPNAVDESRDVAAIRLLLHQFASPLVLILVFGAVVSLFVRDWIDAAMILVIVHRQRVPRVHAGVPRVRGRRGAAQAAGAHGARAARRRGANGRRDRDRAGRRDRALRRQPRPGGRRDPRGPGLPGERGEPHGRVDAGREAAGRRGRERRRCRRAPTARSWERPCAAARPRSSS